MSTLKSTVPTTTSGASNSQAGAGNVSSAVNTAAAKVNDAANVVKSAVSSSTNDYRTNFYKMDEQFNRAVFNTIYGGIEGAVVGLGLALFLKGKRRALWTGVGLGAGYSLHASANEYRNFKTDYLKSNQ